MKTRKIWHLFLFRFTTDSI